MNRAILTLILCCCATWLLASNGKFVVVIDAGHGGKDPGAVGPKKTREKDNTLAIALRLGELINANFTDVKVIYTRTTDEFIALDRRAEIANDAAADLFISIHCNATATNKSSAIGTETYTLGMHAKDSNLEVALRENESVLFEDGYTAKYEGYDPNSPQAYIMLSMFQSAYITQSLRFAEKIEKAFDTSGRHSKGVYQAGFLVLRKTAMPSVLIETGYISHPKEELFLASKEGREIIAKSILAAFTEYKASIDNNKKAASNAAATPKPERTMSVQNTVKVSAPEPAKAVEKPTTPTPAPATETKKSGVRVISKTPIDNTPAAAPVKAGTVPQIVSFAVQLCTVPQKPNLQVAPLSKVTDALSEKWGTQYIVRTSCTEDYYEALKTQGYWRENGYPDATLIAYRGITRITIEDAKQSKGIKK